MPEDVNELLERVHEEAGDDEREIQTLLIQERARREAEESVDRGKKLYTYLERTGRRGVIIDDSIDGRVDILGPHVLKETATKNKVVVEMDGKVVGVITRGRFGDEESSDDEFDPEKNTNVFYASALEEEMKAIKKKL